jgi:hypothetical protein
MCFILFYIVFILSKARAAPAHHVYPVRFVVMILIFLSCSFFSYFFLFGVVDVVGIDVVVVINIDYIQIAEFVNGTNKNISVIAADSCSLFYFLRLSLLINVLLPPRVVSCFIPANALKSVYINEKDSVYIYINYNFFHKLLSLSSLQFFFCDG